MKTTIEKFGFKTRELNIGIGVVYAFFDDKFGIGFSVTNLPNYDIYLLIPIIKGCTPNSYKVPQAITSVGSFKADLERMKNKLRNTLHIEREIARETFNSFIKDSEIAQMCKDSLKYIMGIHKMLSVACSSLGGSVRGTQIFSNDGSMATAMSINYTDSDHTAIYIEVYKDKVAFLSKDKNDNLTMKINTKEQYLTQILGEKEDVDNVLFAFHDYHDIIGLTKFVDNRIKKFMYGHKTVVTLI